jgi:hypothetical protein
MGLAYVNGVQKGQRRNVGKKAIARMAANCKHYAAFGTPQGGLYVQLHPLFLFASAKTAVYQ